MKLKLIALCWILGAGVAGAQSPSPAVGDYRVILSEEGILHNLARRERIRLLPNKRDRAREDAIVAAVQKGNLERLPIDDELTLKLAMGAFLHHRISSDDVATLLMRWMVWRDFRDRLVAPPHSHLVAEASGRLTPFGQALFAPALKERVVPERWEGFPPNLSSLSRTLTLFAVPRRMMGVGEKAEKVEPTQVKLAPGLLYSENLEAFVSKDQVAVMAPSVAIINSYLSARNGKYAVTMRPEIKSSNASGFLEDMAQGYRPLGLSYPDVWIPPSAIDPFTGYLLNPTVFLASDLQRGLRCVEVSYLRVLPRLLRVIDHWYADRKERGDASRYELVPGLVTVDESKVEWGKDKSFVGNRADMFAHQVMDLDLPSQRCVPGEWKPKSMGESLVQDFGSVAHGFSGIFVMDRQAHPDQYRALKVPAEVLKQMGPEAEALQEKLGKGGQEFRLRPE